MKNIVILAFFTSVVHFTYGQQGKEVRGSFVVNDNLYNYTYLLSSGDLPTHSFKIYPANANANFLNVNLKQLIDTSRNSLDQIKGLSNFLKKESRIDSVISKLITIQYSFDSIQKGLVAINSLYKNILPSINKTKQQQDSSINVLANISNNFAKIDTASIQSFTTTVQSFTNSLTSKIPDGDVSLSDFFKSMQKDLTSLNDSTYKPAFVTIQDALNRMTKVYINNKDYVEKTDAILQTTFDLIKNYIPNTNDLKAVIFNDLSSNTFYTAFSKQLSQYEDKYLKKIAKDSIEKEAYKVLVYQHFYRIQNRILLVDDEPLTAYLFVNTLNVPVHKNSLGKDDKIKYLKLSDIQIEFADGAMKNILISLNDTTIKGQIFSEILFRNNVPIAVSGKFKPEKFIDHKIYCSKCWIENNGVRADGYIKLGELLTYKIIYSLDNEDYSPAQSIVKLTPQETFAELKKEKRSRLFEVRAYTDLIGINGKNPNGLLQLELRKRINILTQPHQRLGGSFGYFAYFEPFVRYSKIESTNKYYIINEPMSGDSKYNVNVLQAHRYQNFSIGSELNLFKLSIPNIISDFYINSGAYWHYTPVSFDTLQTSSTVKSTSMNSDYFNFLSFRIGGVWQLNPDGRLGLNFLGDVIVSEIESTKFKKDNASSTIFSLGMEAFFKPNDTGKVFGRFKWNAQSMNVSNNYYILQIGYLFDIFNNKRF